MIHSYSCKKISPGITEGEVLISEEELLFYFTEPDTGRITESGHSLEGKSITGKILVFPGGKGSSVVQADGLYRLEKQGTQPAGFIVQNPDTVLVSCAVIMAIPMVSKVSDDFYHIIRDGMRVRINSDLGIIEILEQNI